MWKVVCSRVVKYFPIVYSLNTSCLYKQGSQKNTKHNIYNCYPSHFCLWWEKNLKTNDTSFVSQFCFPISSQKDKYFIICLVFTTTNYLIMKFVNRSTFKVLDITMGPRCNSKNFKTEFFNLWGSNLNTMFICG